MTNAWFLGLKVFAVFGLVTIAALFAGDLTGTGRVYPWRERFYLVPGPQPDATPSGLRR